MFEHESVFFKYLKCPKEIYLIDDPSFFALETIT